MFQYFQERFEDDNGVILPIKFNRKIVRKVESKEYVYSAKDDDEVVEDDFDFEEDEEYRVRSAVITAISCIRAKDGQTPMRVLNFLLKVLQAEDGPSLERDDDCIDAKRSRLVDGQTFFNDPLIADSLLSLCNINVKPAEIGAPFNIVERMVGSTSHHPIITLLQVCKNWLNWALYKERLVCKSKVGIGMNSPISPAAITALYILTLLHHSTSPPNLSPDSDGEKELLLESATAKYYVDIMDSQDVLTDATRAAAAQAVACILCASDRLKDKNQNPVGLLSALEFLLERIRKYILF